MSRVILLLNRAAGGSERGLDVAEVARTVENVFHKEGHEISSVLLEPSALGPALDKAIADKPDIIIIGGGDGSVATAAGRLGGSGIAMGILPMGTFNLAARDLGVPLDLTDAAGFLASAAVRLVDVMDVAGRTCLCTTILGFYPEYSNVFEKRDHGGRWWRKTFTLLTELRRSFLLARPLDLVWESDGGSGRARSKFSAFVPGHYEKSAGLIPLRGGFRSGTLTAYIGTQRNPASALRGIFDYALGRHEENPDLLIVRASSMTLRAVGRKQCSAMLDGEILKLAFPLELKILPGHLAVLASAPESENPS